MTYEEALVKIKNNWANLPHEILEEHEVVWIIESDISAPYETDYEKIGMKQDSTLIWAYASGCSCWDGDYAIHEFHDPKEMLTFEFNHDQVKTDWQKMIIDFVESKQLLT